MTSSINISQAWKDSEYRDTLSEAQLAALPSNPVGIIELDEAELSGANGGATPVSVAYAGSALLGAVAGGASVYITTR